MRFKKLISLLLAAATAIGSTVAGTVFADAFSQDVTLGWSSIVYEAKKPEVRVTLGESGTIGTSNTIVGLEILAPTIFTGEAKLTEGVFLDNEYGTFSLEYASAESYPEFNLFKDGNHISGGKYRMILTVNTKSGYYIGDRQLYLNRGWTKDNAVAAWLVYTGADNRSLASGFSSKHVSVNGDNTFYKAYIDYSAFDRVEQEEGYIFAALSKDDPTGITDVYLDYQPKIAQIGEPVKNYYLECGSCILLAYLDYSAYEKASAVERVGDNMTYCGEKGEWYVYNYIVYAKPGYKFGTEDSDGDLTVNLELYDGIRDNEDEARVIIDGYYDTESRVGTETVAFAAEVKDCEYLSVSLDSAVAGNKSYDFDYIDDSGLDFADNEEIDGFENYTDYFINNGVYCVRYIFDGDTDADGKLKDGTTYKVNATVFPSYGVRFTENTKVRGVTARGYLVPDSDTKLNDNGTISFTYYSETDPLTATEAYFYNLFEGYTEEVYEYIIDSRLNEANYIDGTSLSLEGDFDADGKTIAGNVYKVNVTFETLIPKEDCLRYCGFTVDCCHKNEDGSFGESVVEKLDFASADWSDDYTVTFSYYVRAEELFVLTNEHQILQIPYAGMPYNVYKKLPVGGVYEKGISGTGNYSIYIDFRIQSLKVNGEAPTTSDKVFAAGDEVTITAWLMPNFETEFPETLSYKWYDLFGNDISSAVTLENINGYTKITVNYTIPEKEPISKLIVEKINFKAGKKYYYGNDYTYKQEINPFFGNDAAGFKAYCVLSENDCINDIMFDYTRSAAEGLKYGERPISGQAYRYTVKSTEPFPFEINDDTQVLVNDYDGNARISDLKIDENGYLTYTVTVSYDNNAKHYDRATAIWYDDDDDEEEEPLPEKTEAEKKAELIQKAIDEAVSETVDGETTKVVSTTPELAAEVIAAALKNKAEGEKVRVAIDMSGTTVLSKEIISALKGTDAAVELKMSAEYSWIIDGATLDPDFDYDSLDMKVSFTDSTIPETILNDANKEFEEELGDKGMIMTLNLSHNGEFGFTPILKLFIGTDKAGWIAAVAYYSPEDEELQPTDMTGIVDENGYLSLAYSHASEYLLAIVESEAIQKALDEIDGSGAKSEEQPIAEDEEVPDEIIDDEPAYVVKPDDETDVTDGNEESDTTVDSDADTNPEKEENADETNPATGIAFAVLPTVTAAAVAFGAKKKRR